VVAQQMVAILRRAAGTRGDNPRLVALVAELTAASPDFACWWADHRIFRHTHGPKTIHHELGRRPARGVAGADRTYTRPCVEFPVQDRGGAKFCGRGVPDS
jgi:hypothetical protein